MPPASNGQTLNPPSTKRPRTHPPSSPSEVGSSPKRSPPTDDTTSYNLSSPPAPQGRTLRSSSPMEVDSSADGDTVGWVSRTGRVSLNENESVLSQDPAAVKQVYDALLSSLPPPFTAHSTFYLIPKPFLPLFSQHALGQLSSPPPLDLLSIVVDEAPVRAHALVRTADGKISSEEQTIWKLKPGLEEDEDFMYIGVEGWTKLAELYQYPPDRPHLARRGLPGDRVELVPSVFSVHIVGPPVAAGAAAPSAGSPSLPPFKITASGATTIPDFKLLVRVVLKAHIPVGSPLRLWQLEGDSPASLTVQGKDVIDLGGKLVKGGDSVTLADSGFSDGDALVVELQVRERPNSSAIWTLATDPTGKAVEKAASPLFAKPAFYSAGTASTGSAASSTAGPSSVANSTALLPSSNQMATRSQTRGRGGPHGLVGLNNLGNTCFLASATQCLSNTAVLADYFLSGVYRDELNPDNPLGMHGQIAEAFGEVIENLHNSAPHSSFSPRRLKGTCSRFAPQFAGYGQQDTQEFLAFLLDGLHEDLNRIKKKPYIEKPDWKPGGGDRELAEIGKECWEGYKKRNDSVIVDLFQGQLQSTLVCPECHKESITLDPFMYLTVPLPIAQTRVFKLVYFPKDTDKPPVNVELLVPVNASFASLKDRLGSLVGAKGSEIVGFDYWKGGIYTWWKDGDANSEAKDNDTCIFHELGVPVSATHRVVGTMPTDRSLTVPVFTFVANQAPRSSFGRDVPTDGSLEPFFITLSRAEAADPAAVRAAIVRGYTRLVRPEMAASLLAQANSPHAKEIEDDDTASDIYTSASEGRKSTDTNRDSRKSTETTRDSLSPLAAITPLSGGAAEPASPIQRTGSSLSLSSATGIVPRADLFKVHVADAGSAETTGMSFFKAKPDPSVNSLYRGNPSSACGSWSSLDKRARAKRPMLQRISSSLTNFVGSANNSDDESEDAPASNANAVVRPGEAIFVEWQSNTFDDFFERNRESLLRNLEYVVDPAIAKDAAKKREGRSITLDDCLDEFAKEETLGEDDLWYCPVCKKHQAATKKLDIYQAPDILVICLKRFGSSRTMRDKLDHLVSFPVQGLDLDDRVTERRLQQTLKLSPEEAKHYGIANSTEEYIYDLYAVDNHFGGLGGGHYTAYCKNQDDGNWYNFDDSRVSRASPENVVTRAAYLLFYRRRTNRRIGGISRIKAEEASRAATPFGSRAASPLGIAPSVPQSVMAGSTASGSITPVEHSPVLSSDSDDADVNVSDDEDNLPLRRGTITANNYAYHATGTNAGDILPGYSAVDDGTTLQAAGRAVGYGNTAWGQPSINTSGLQHSFAGNGLPTPDGSDEEEFPLRPGVPRTQVMEVTSGPTLTAGSTAASMTTSVSASVPSSVSSDYQIVPSDGGSANASVGVTSASDSEMVSGPRSPESEVC